MEQRLTQRLRRARAAARQRCVRHGQPQPRAQLARRFHLRRAQLAALGAARQRMGEGGGGDGHELCGRGERTLIHSGGTATAWGRVAQRVHVGPEVGGRRQPQHRADACVACRAAHGAYALGTRVAHAVERGERQQQHEQQHRHERGLVREPAGQRHARASILWSVGRAILLIVLACGLVGEHGVRLDDVEKNASGVGLLVLVRVELEGEAPVRLADLRRGGAGAQAECLVGIEELLLVR